MGGTCSSAGGICPRRSTVDRSPNEKKEDTSKIHDNGDLTRQIRLELHKMNESTLKNPDAEENLIPPPTMNITEKKGRDESPSFPRKTLPSKPSSTKKKPDADAKAAMPKVSGRRSLSGKSARIGLGKAVKVTDKFAIKTEDLSTDDDFDAVITAKGTEISILAFEVANTIVRGSNLMRSLSKENVIHLKEVVLHSVGVRLLVSNDMDELLKFVAADKREELNIVSREVIRFGNCCKDPQWHNLDLIFQKPDYELTSQKQPKEEAQAIMQQLIIMVQNTAELYHEWQALDKVEQDYRRRYQEENASQGENSLHVLRQELKGRKMHVRSLKKKSLWSKNFDEIVEKLVDVVNFLKLEIKEAFGDTCGGAGGVPGKELTSFHPRLGSAGLALHYANVISQISTLMLRARVPKSARDMLYQALPPNTKTALRSKLQLFHVNEELSTLEIKAEMTKILDWLAPIASNTTKIHHGFGWVGEWANTGSGVPRNPARQTYLTRIETLHHASKERTDSYILDLVLWLHHLVSHNTADNGASRSPIKSPIRSPTKSTIFLGNNPNKSPEFTKEEQEMLQVVIFKRLTPGISKSQELDMGKMRSNNDNILGKSSHSSTSGSEERLLPKRRASTLPEKCFQSDRKKALDVIDRVDNLEGS